MAFQCNLSVIFALPAALVKILLKPDNLGVHDNKPYKSYSPSLLHIFCMKNIPPAEKVGRTTFAGG